MNLYVLLAASFCACSISLAKSIHDGDSRIMMERTGTGIDVKVWKYLFNKMNNVIKNLFPNNADSSKTGIRRASNNRSSPVTFVALKNVYDKIKENVAGVIISNATTTKGDNVGRKYASFPSSRPGKGVMNNILEKMTNLVDKLYISTKKTNANDVEGQQIYLAKDPPRINENDALRSTSNIAKVMKKRCDETEGSASGNSPEPSLGSGDDPLCEFSGSGSGSGESDDVNWNNNEKIQRIVINRSDRKETTTTGKVEVIRLVPKTS